MEILLLTRKGFVSAHHLCYIKKKDLDSNSLCRSSLFPDHSAFHLYCGKVSITTVQLLVGLCLLSFVLSMLNQSMFHLPYSVHSSLISFPNFSSLSLLYFCCCIISLQFRCTCFACNWSGCNISAEHLVRQTQGVRGAVITGVSHLSNSFLLDFWSSGHSDGIIFRTSTSTESAPITLIYQKIFRSPTVRIQCLNCQDLPPAMFISMRGCFLGTFVIGSSCSDQ